MNKFKILGFVLLISFGAFMVVYGGMDDSPGAQGLGVVAVIFGIVKLIRGRKKASNSEV